MTGIAKLSPAFNDLGSLAAIMGIFFLVVTLGVKEERMRESVRGERLQAWEVRIQMARSPEERDMIAFAKSRVVNQLCGQIEAPTGAGGRRENHRRRMLAAEDQCLTQLRGEIRAQTNPDIAIALLDSIPQ